MCDPGDGHPPTGRSDFAAAFDPGDQQLIVFGGDPGIAQNCTSNPEFSGETWLYEPGSVAHDYLVHRATAGAETVLSGHVVSEYATQIALVAAGIGIALVPRMGRGDLPASVRALSIAGPPIRGIYGVWREAAGNRPAIVAALDALQQACARTQDR